MLKKAVFLGSFLFVAALAADDGVDLKVNGDFRGAAVNAAFAPGWSAAVNPDDLTKPAGTSKILPTKDPKDFSLEITAPEKANAVSVSEFYPVAGSELKFEAEASGSGKATLIVFQYDQKKQLIVAERFSAPVTQKRAELKKRFPIRKNASFVRIGLAAEAGSKVVFEDVDAEFKGVRASAPAAAVPVEKPVQKKAAASAPAVKKAAAPAEKPVQKKAAAPAEKPVQKKAAATAEQPAAKKNKKAATAVKDAAHAEAWKKATLILNKDDFDFEDLKKNPYRAELTVQGEMEFTITENRKKKQIWTVIDYDPAIIKLEVDHEKGGWFSSDRAEIEIKGLTRGRTILVLSCGKKTMRVFCNVR